jgi:hypothetical protein
LRAFVERRDKYFSGAPVRRAYLSRLDAPVCTDASAREYLSVASAAACLAEGGCNRNVTIAMNLEGINRVAREEFAARMRRESPAHTT